MGDAQMRSAEMRRKEIDDLTWKVVQAMFFAIATSRGDVDMQVMWQAARNEIEKGYP